MSLQSLPTELLAQVCSFIDDIQSLRHCALVCRALNHTAERYLYESLVVESKEQNDILQTALESRRRRAEYVRGLEIRRRKSQVTDGTMYPLTEVGVPYDSDISWWSLLPNLAVLKMRSPTWEIGTIAQELSKVKNGQSLSKLKSCM